MYSNLIKAIVSAFLFIQNTLGKLLSVFLFLLTFVITSSSFVLAAPGCDNLSSSNTGTFAGLTDQQGGFGNPDGIKSFLEANGLVNPTRIDKVDGLQGNTSCQTGDNNFVSAKNDNANDNTSGKWASDLPICAVAIHAGGGQRVAVYIYEPPVSQGAWTTANNKNKQGNPQAISNIQFFTCDQNGGGDPKGILRLKKTTESATPPDNVPPGQVGDNTFRLKLTRTSDNAEFTTLLTVNKYGTSTETEFSLTPGTYVFSEDLPPVQQDIPADSAWQQSSLQCVLTNDNGGGTQIANNTEVTLGANDIVTCTATNTLVGNQDTGTGKIIIKKKTVNGTAFPAKFDFTWLEDNGEGLLNPSKTFGSNSTEKVFEQDGLRVGQYIIREEDLAGWKLSDVSCNDGNSSGNKASKQAVINLEKMKQLPVPLQIHLMIQH